MTVKDVAGIIEGWYPREIAWDRDNVGLQVGAGSTPVKAIMVCLDVTESTIREALRRHADLVVSHHPLLFKPLRSVDLTDQAGHCVKALLNSGISLYSAHTNLDFSRGGTSFALAERLALTRVDFLHKSYRLKKKIVTFVPPEHLDKVAKAMGDAGAGRIGNYESCSFQSEGVGTFRGNSNSTPSIGQRGRLERVPEMRLEMMYDQMDVRHIVEALRSSHPYEEVAYDVYPLENVSDEYGMGIIGELSKSMTVVQFVDHVKKRLGSGAVRYASGGKVRVQRIAACGGSGSELTAEAIRQGADAFVTADVKYHSFQDAINRILLIDAGHYETERPIVNAVAARLSKELKHRGVRISVHASRISTNPIVSH